jgi:hypothetical protein
MGVLPFCISGFLDGVRRPPPDGSSPNHNFRSCRFGISMHRSMDSPEPSGEESRGRRDSVPSTYSTGDFHRFKRPPDGRWHGLELEMIPCCLSVVNCVRFHESEYYMFRLLLIVKTQELACISFPRLTTTRQVLPCFLE